MLNLLRISLILHKKIMIVNMKIDTFITTLSKKREIAENVLELQFKKPKGFKHDAGQFIQFLIPHENKLTSRSYSISSTTTDTHLEFCIKNIPNGIGSTKFTNMSVGDSLEFRGPHGKFILNQKAISHTFIATGVGLAPIMSILREELENKKSNKSLELLFGVRSEEDMFWIDRIVQLKKTYKNFFYTLCLSNPKGILPKNTVNGRVTRHLPKSFRQSHLYICGSSEMVIEVRKKAIELGADIKKIYFEIF